MSTTDQPTMAGAKTLRFYQVAVANGPDLSLILAVDGLGYVWWRRPEWDTRAPWRRFSAYGAPFTQAEPNGE